MQFKVSLLDLISNNRRDDEVNVVAQEDRSAESFASAVCSVHTHDFLRSPPLSIRRRRVCMYSTTL